MAWTRLPKHSPCRSSRILAEEARTEHGTRQRSNGHVRGARLDGVADLGVRVEEEKLGFFSKLSLFLKYRIGTLHFWQLKETVPSFCFEQPHLYNFEDVHFYGVSDADTYLSHLYGNYNKVPPKSKQHIHVEYAYINE